LLNLPNYNIYLRLLIDGVPSRPFSAMTLPPYPKPEVSFAEEIIEYSRKTYGTPQDQVEKAIAEATGVIISAENLSEHVSEIPKKEELRYTDKKLYDATCSNCNKKVKVPFKPDPNRPVYCSDCFAKTKDRREPPKPVHLSQLKPRPTDAKAMVGKENFTSPPLFRTKTFTDKQETKKQRKTVDTEELKKVLEETIRK